MASITEQGTPISARYWQPVDITQGWFGQYYMPHFNHIAGIQRLSISLKALRFAFYASVEDSSKTTLQEIYRAARVITLLFEQGCYNNLRIFQRNWGIEDIDKEFFLVVQELYQAINFPEYKFDRFMDPETWNYLGNLLKHNMLFNGSNNALAKGATYFVREEKLRENPEFWGKEFQYQAYLYLGEMDTRPMFGHVWF